MWSRRLGTKRRWLREARNLYEYDSISLTAGEDYVMFLHGRSGPDGYPSRVRDTL